MADIELPNVRKIFIPDPGYLIFEADLKGADVWVVAAEANDNDLLETLGKGLDVHDKNAIDLWGSSYASLDSGSGLRAKKRKQNKQAVHATNYGGSARTVAITLGWSVSDASNFQRRWFELHPGIKGWHDRVEFDLQTTRRARNRFGYRIIYFDRIAGLLPQALAWIPQSTVAITSFRGAINLQKEIPQTEILMQAHDSLVFQIPLSDLPTDEEIHRALRIPVPYDPPITIPCQLTKSLVSWGDCK